MLKVDLQGLGVAPAATGRAFVSAESGLIFSAERLPRLGANRTYQLWVIPKDQAPISLGVMDLAKPYRIPVPPELYGEGRTTAQLVVTAEQLGGSPDKKPHGPAIAAGQFS